MELTRARAWCTPLGSHTSACDGATFFLIYIYIYILGLGGGEGGDIWCAKIIFLIHPHNHMSGGGGEKFSVRRREMGETPFSHSLYKTPDPCFRLGSSLLSKAPTCTSSPSTLLK